MPREFSNWKNQYIDLIGTKPEFIRRLLTESDEHDARSLIFDRACNRNLCVELGCGSGGHLVALAERNPHKFYVGFELRFKRVFKGAGKGENLKLSNFLILQGDAKKLPNLFPTNSVETLYVNFPDPWEKARWRKHRLLQQSFLEVIFDTLKVGGTFRYKSDHRDYFQETASLLLRIPGIRVESMTDDLYQSDVTKDNIPSEFEMLFRSQGLPIYFLEAKKLDDFQSSRIIAK